MLRQERKVNTNIYSPALFTEKVELPISEVNRAIHSTIESILKKRREGTCTVDGYVRPNSVKLTQHSAGEVQSGGIVRFEACVECETYYPVAGALISCKVQTLSKAGIQCIQAPQSRDNEVSPFTLVIPRDLTYTDSNANAVKVDDIITCRVICSRWELGDPYVSIIGELV